MNHKNLPFTYSDENAHSIAGQFFTIESSNISFNTNILIKLEVTIAIICRKGELRCNVNSRGYTAQYSSMIVMMPKQTIKIKAVSDDFDGFIIFMTEKFTENLEIKDRLFPFLSIINNSYIPLQEVELNSLDEYSSMAKKLSKSTENLLILESIKHLTKAYFYGLGYALFSKKENENKNNSRHELLVKDFLDIAQKHYYHHRNVTYYSDILNLTPKYLSKIIKFRTGFSASEWIDKFVLMEANVLLKSTDLTVQQIADKLNFPSQSFFGKYFKRNVGVSPRQFRKENR